MSVCLVFLCGRGIYVKFYIVRLRFVAGKIQVTEETAKILEDMYQFEHRGTIFVKGKGDMKTYLLVKKRIEPLLTYR